MSTTSREEHFGRSAELQRLLDEADSSSPPAGRRPRPSATPAPAADHAVDSVPTRSQRPSPDVPGIPRPRTSTDAGGMPAGPAAPRVAQAPSRPTGVGRPASPTTRPAPDPVTRPNLRSSPAVTFPRRVRPAAGRSTPETSTEPTARLRRTALVRSPIERAGIRSAGSDRTARMVPASRKSAVARSVAGRWGAAGYLPEQRAVAGPLAAARTPLLPAATAPPVPPTPPAGPIARATGDQRPTPARPPTRPTQRRTLVLAGGVAAAVVAIVAIVSIGNRSGSGPATDAVQNPPTKVAMVQVTGADGQATVTTVTAPVGTVNGQLIALVADADGQVRQLAVVTAPPEVPARTSAPPVRTSAPAAGGASTPTAAPTDPAAPGNTAAATGTPAPAAGATGTQPPTTAATPSAPRSTSAVPGAPGDVATVVTGLTTLTGWEPVTTN